MKSFLFIALVTVLVGHSAKRPPPKERKLYIGKDSVEATMTFSYEVLFEAEKKPSVALAHEKIEAQLNHLFGPMGEARYYAVPKGDHEVTLGTIEESEVHEGYYVAHYDYSGTIVVKVPSKGLPDTYQITLPLIPDEVYDSGIVTTKSGKETYPCTDSHYTEEGDFWYFWNPNQEGCELSEGKDYVRLDAKVVGRPNTRSTYPEYARLVDANGEITLSVLVGMDDPEKNDRNPYETKDESGPTYRSISMHLENKGYERHRWTRKEIQAVSGEGRPYPYVEEFVKPLEKATLRVLLFFGESGTEEQSDPFHYFFKRSIEQDAVMVYDGHSGLGDHLEIPQMEEKHGFKFKIPKDRYQIYFFNSCSSYSYYNKSYFAPKATDADPRGIKNLEILTNGLATYFAIDHSTDLELIKAIETWAAGKASVSYQALTKKIDSGNLFGVNGDEDNPTRP